MNKPDLDYGYWILVRLAKTLGVWGLLGIILILASSVCYFVYFLPASKQLIQAKNELQNKLEYTQKNSRENTPKQIQAQVVPFQTSTQEIAEFYKQFPPGGSLPKWLRLIDTTALKRHLVLNRGDYKLTQSKQGQLQRYEMVLPISGNYVQIRQFISDVLQQLPALALSDIQIKRDNAMSPTVEARLVFMLFLQGDSWLK